MHWGVEALSATPFCLDMHDHKAYGNKAATAVFNKCSFQCIYLDRTTQHNLEWAHGPFG